MKTINFSVLKILPALLDRTKCQTIRPAWKEDSSYPKRKKESEELGFTAFKGCDELKPPKYKVGDKVNLKWTGSHTELQKVKGFGLQNRDLGEAEIIEVFKIKLMNTLLPLERDGMLYGMIQLDDLAKKDGFKNAEEMLEFFKRYGLPKKFWVYRWKWISPIS